MSTTADNAAGLAGANYCLRADCYPRWTRRSVQMTCSEPRGLLDTSEAGAV